MNQLGAFLVIFALSASSTSAYPDKPPNPNSASTSSSSSSSSRFPNLLAPLRNIFSKRLTSEHSEKQQQQKPAQGPIAIPVQFVPQLASTAVDSSGAETASSEFNWANIAAGGLSPRPVAVPYTVSGGQEAVADLNDFDSASPSPQFTIGRPSPMRLTMRDLFRRRRRGPRPAAAAAVQMQPQGFEDFGGQGQVQAAQQFGSGGGGGGGGGRPYNMYPMEHNSVEQFNNNLDVGGIQPGKPVPYQLQQQAYGHYGSGPQVGQSFQQPQQQFPGYSGGLGSVGGRRPTRMRGRPFYAGGGGGGGGGGYGAQMQQQQNGVFPYPSVVRGQGQGGGRGRPFRPSRPDAAGFDDGSSFGGGGGGGSGFSQQSFPSGGGFQQGDEVIYGQGSGGFGGGGGAGGGGGFGGSGGAGPNFGGGGGGGGGRVRGNRFQRQPQVPFTSASAEPDIITLDDLQNQGYQFGLVGQSQSQSPGSGYDGFDGQFQGRPGSTRPITSYSNQQQDEVVIRRPKGGRIYQSRPLRSPGGRLNPYPMNSDEVSTVFKSSTPVPGSLESNEEILYGKPMAMSSTSSSSSSSSEPSSTTTRYRPAEHSTRRPMKKSYVKPYLLKPTTKNPNYVKSSTISDPGAVDGTVNGELQQSASSFGGGGGGELGSELAGGNGDRILFHVSGHKGPYSYRWGYDTGKGYNRMFRFEEKDESGYVKGKYGYQDKHGKMNVVNYEAHPEAGYHQQPTNY